MSADFSWSRIEMAWLFDPTSSVNSLSEIRIRTNNVLSTTDEIKTDMAPSLFQNIQIGKIHLSFFKQYLSGFGRLLDFPRLLTDHNVQG